jgi:type I restriction enzyme M protein
LLDTDTKRRIDTARDILVGKVPDPKSQVEQITIALIYKFMDDMDAEAEELGGKRKFFTGDYARFGWAKLMRAGLGGHETLNLYAESIATMPKNPGIPPLFREIFKNAYLPYRDPETLKSFLKIIDEFSYDHSERLGDAFEYLLSVLGSQGDAGQFRTPRHIIDFIVSIVDPKKTDTILDPACGTAGFLISAYKHVLAANTDAKGKVNLTPDERGILAQHIKGYDISPDMVRLSLVNLYLHGFTDPHIYEYDTLTQEERWNELADVILANPPFMSPKGGIKPHRKFSIDAKRSEVLFVDYMAEHLTTNGRAGIIVPEGIIFQSQGAYRDLRKMLVKNSLVAVISLPAGCFNPYSGVKTSILILDKSIAKQSESVSFFKIENDGFSLGAQRRSMGGSELPEVKAEIDAYIHALRTDQPTKELQLTHGLVVPKEQINANGDYNLSGDRYRVAASITKKYPLVELSELAENLDSKRIPITKGDRKPGPYPYYGASGIVDWVDGFIFDENILLISEDGANLLARSTPIAFSVSGRCWVNNHAHVLRFENPITQRLIEIYLNSIPIDRYVTGAAQPKLNQEALNGIQVPLPPLDVQKNIVGEIDGYQQVIDGARAVLKGYRPYIAIESDWPLVQLADVCETITDGDHLPPPKASDGVPFVTITNITDDHKLDFTKTFFVSESYYAKLSPSRRPKVGDILYTVTGSYGIPVLLKSDVRFCFQRHIALIRTGPELLNTFLYFLLSTPFMLQQGDAAATGVAQKTVSLTSLRNFKVPLPPLPIQQSIAAEIEAEQMLVEANRKLIVRFEEKIQATLARVWGEDEP